MPQDDMASWLGAWLVQVCSLSACQLVSGVTGKTECSVGTERTVHAKVNILWVLKFTSSASVRTECCVASGN